jgi:hypothetical protein
MNTTEDRLREALDSAAETVHRDDLRPLVAPPKPSRRRRLVLMVAGALAAVTLATLQLLPASAEQAFATWTPVAGPPDDNLLRTVGKQCAGDIQGMAGGSTEVERALAAGPVRPFLVDRRGASAVAIVTAGEDYVAACRYVGVNPKPYANGELRFHAAAFQWAAERTQALGTAKLTVEALSSVASGHGALASTYGQIATDVTKVVVVLDDGLEVQATTKDGWYLAWWPEEIQRGVLFRWTVDHREVDVIRAYDASGKLLTELRPEGVPGR